MVELLTTTHQQNDYASVSYWDGVIN